MDNAKPKKEILRLEKSLGGSVGFMYGSFYVVVALVAHRPVSIDNLAWSMFFFMALDFLAEKKLKYRYLRDKCLKGKIMWLLGSVTVLAGVVVALV